jgi:nucleoside phosphorylase
MDSLEITGPSASSFVIVTALEEERDAFLKKLSSYRKIPPTQDDIRVYFYADVPFTYPDGTGGTYSVVVTCLPGMGRIKALNATKDAINRWRPHYVFLVGIAGGVETNGVSLGDVLVSDLVVDYELQKVMADGESYRFDPHKADPRLVGAAQNLLGNQWQEIIEVPRPLVGEPKRHIGPVATGDKVVERTAFLNQLLVHWPKLIGIEMEAGGVASGCFEAVRQPGFFMVRGVSDLADENKQTEGVKGWRSYACDVAASYAVALLRTGPIPLGGQH